jgi:hypothetical protein
MRYFTVTMKIGYEDYHVGPNPMAGDELLDAVLSTLGEHLPEAQILEYCQHEEILVNKELYEELVHNLEPDFAEAYDDMHLPLDQYSPTVTTKAKPPTLTEEEQDAFNDWIAVTGEMIKDAEDEQGTNEVK